MSASVPLPSAPIAAPQRHEVRRETMVVEGHALSEVELAGYLIGQPLGAAPVVVIVGGITASPFPFGDPTSGAEAWWPALQAPDLVDLSCATVLCPCWPGNGSTWRGFERSEMGGEPAGAAGAAGGKAPRGIERSEMGGEPAGAAGAAGGKAPRGNGDGAVPALSALGLADLIAAWLDGLGCTAPVTYVGASL